MAYNLYQVQAARAWAEVGLRCDSVCAVVRWECFGFDVATVCLGTWEVMLSPCSFLKRMLLAQASSQGV